MELYTLDRGFLKQETIDEFDSVIWTERYYGAGDFELVVPGTTAMISKLYKGVLMMCEDSDIPMILETRELTDVGNLKTTGIDLIKWLNNRIFRTSADHSVKEQNRDDKKPGELLSYLVGSFCIEGNYLNGTNNIATDPIDRDRFKIPGLIQGTMDTSGSPVEISLPFGPIYDLLDQIAQTYEIGLSIKLDWADETGYEISFNNFKGEDRTSGQSENPVIQFSKEMDSFTNITDLDSIAEYKNLVLAFAANAPPTYMTNDAGRATSVSDTTTGFDLRIAQEFSDFNTSGLDVTRIRNVLDEKAKLVVQAFKPVQLVDGEIVQNEQIKYGRDYFLGDIVEVVGNTGVLQNARIAEYIRSQDNAGERAYPTLAMIDE